MKSNRRRTGDPYALMRQTLSRRDASAPDVNVTKKLEASGESRGQAMPCENPADTGYVKLNVPEAELKASPFLTGLETAPDFDALEYKTWDIKVFRFRMKRYFEKLRRAESAEEAAPVLREVSAMWAEFREQAEISKFRAAVPGPGQAFYKEELARAVQTAPLFEKSVLKLASAVLSKPWLEDLGAIFGKSFLLRLNSYYTLYELGSQDLRTEERKLTDTLLEQAELQAPLAHAAKGLRQPDILLDDLIRLRNEMGHKLGFGDYREYVMTSQRYYDYGAEMLRALRDGIKRYLLPIHLYLNQDLVKYVKEAGPLNYADRRGRDAAADTGLSPKYERFAENVRDYYERIWGDEDWELRHIGDVLPDETASGEAERPMSRLFLPKGKPEELFLQLAGIADRTLPRQSRGFLRLLGAKGYVKLAEDREGEPFRVTMLASSGCPLLTGGFHVSSTLAADFLGLAGETYAMLLAEEAGTAFMPMLSMSPGNRSFQRQAFELMALSHMEPLFGEQAPAYARQRVTRLLRRLLKACLIDEFEEAIYRQPELSMSDRLELWRHLRENYGMTYYSHEVFWADRDVRDALLEHPFASLIRKLPLVAAFSLWDISRKSRKQARNDYEAICRLGATETFLHTLTEAMLPDPFTIDNLKRLAYQIASFLET